MCEVEWHVGGRIRQIWEAARENLNLEAECKACTRKQKADKIQCFLIHVIVNARNLPDLLFNFLP